MARPFLKWAGGKTSLLPQLLAVAPKQIDTYYEPFLGGGALFFALQSEGRFKQAVLSDSNKELINAYIQVRDNVESLIKALRVHQKKYQACGDPSEYYYKIRAKKLTCSRGGAANLIFLNKTCFNGLYRVNSKGEFNVPHGKYKNPAICDTETLRAASEALQGVELRTADFAAAAAEAGKGDFVYFDPPYVPLSETSSFTAYTSKDFGPDEQNRLAETASEAAARGAKLALSNSAHPEVAALYKGKGFKLSKVEAPRSINSNPKKRQRIPELLIHLPCFP